MLNAFRHHRNSHLRAGAIYRAFIGSAQRLSASSEFSPCASSLTKSAIKCAQRLSASSEFSPPNLAKHIQRNSCAQRLSASSEFSLSGDAGNLSRLLVLNAFRHHRNSHSYITISRNQIFIRCSTPFGIIGILTRRCLNTRKPSSRCSTPFGIIGILTIGIGPPPSPVNCAQRLSASSEFSQPGRPV